MDPPQAGVMAANVDAAWIANQAAIAVVVCNFKGDLVLGAANGIEAQLAKMAELKAIKWASSLLEEKGWEKVDWRSDAKRVVDIVSFQGEPTSWWYRKYIIEIQNRLLRQN